jgi:glucose/arabinose dehydrogenase
MKKHFFSALLLGTAGLVGQACQSSEARRADVRTEATTPAAAPVEARLNLVTDQLQLPTAMATANDGSGRLFVIEQEGRVRVLKDGKLQAKPYLDLLSQVVKNSGYDERGLLGLAFHPQFKQNGKLYVYYSAKTSGANHKSVIQEFTASPGADAADVRSGRVLLEFDQPEGNHNGGDIKFGPDGYLYIATGDGGGAGDKHGKTGNGQNRRNLLGKILRIDVNKQPYGVPADNPFVNTPDVRPEIYAYGLRNPWRISFDRQTGQLFAGDVGQNKYEEVNIITKGGNYGWRIREGFHPYDEDQPGTDLLDPIAEYPHAEGISITGGFVYRGSAVPDLKGKYVFADWSGPVWYLTGSDKKWTRGPLTLAGKPNVWQVYSFGEDEAGELYVLAQLTDANKGAVYRVGK